jgi:opacity protein-like surface antigen
MRAKPTRTSGRLKATTRQSVEQATGRDLIATDRESIATDHKRGAPNMRKHLISIAAAVILLLSITPAARADVTLTPFIGSLFGGVLPDNKTNWGFDAAFMGWGAIGAEIDFSYTQEFIPTTFATPEVHQANLMGNLVLGIPFGGTEGKGVRPYVVGGAGLYRATWKNSDFFDRITSNDFAVDAGGGLMLFFSNHVGLRADMRYFRTLRDSQAGSGIDFDLGALNYWRGTIGTTFKF